MSMKQATNVYEKEKSAFDDDVKKEEDSAISDLTLRDESCNVSSTIDAGIRFLAPIDHDVEKEKEKERRSRMSQDLALETAGSPSTFHPSIRNAEKEKEKERRSRVSQDLDTSNSVDAFHPNIRKAIEEALAPSADDMEKEKEKERRSRMSQGLDTANGVDMFHPNIREAIEEALAPSADDVEKEKEKEKQLRSRMSQDLDTANGVDMFHPNIRNAIEEALAPSADVMEKEKEKERFSGRRRRGQDLDTFHPSIHNAIEDALAPSSHDMEKEKEKGQLNGSNNLGAEGHDQASVGMTNLSREEALYIRPGAYHSEPGIGAQRRLTFSPAVLDVGHRTSSSNLMPSVSEPGSETLDIPRDDSFGDHGLVEANPVSDHLMPSQEADLWTSQLSKKPRKPNNGKKLCEPRCTAFVALFCWLLLFSRQSLGLTGSRAYQWVLNDPFLANYSTARLLQRFALATFFYSTGGDHWIENGEISDRRRNLASFVIVDETDTPNQTRPDGHDQGPPPTADKPLLGPNVTEGVTGIGPPGGDPSGGPPSGGGPPGGAPSGGGGGPPPPRPPPKPQAGQFAWLDYQAPHECQWYTMSAKDGKLNCNDDGEYINLIIPENNLAGTLPPELALLSSMEDVFLMGNQISGSLPTELFAGWKRIQGIMMLKNRLSGSLPSEVGLWKGSLRKLHVVANALTGSLPDELWQMTTLKTLHLAKNSLTGTISTAVGNLSSLSLLELGRNNFVSEIPSELGLLTKLTLLQLGGEDLRAIPSEFGRLANIKHMEMTSAGLTGTIPTELGLLTNMLRFAVPSNPKLSGTIPASMTSLLHQNNMNKTAKCSKLPPPKTSDVGDGLRWVSLTETNLTGSMPEEWCNSLAILCFDCSKICGCDCPCD
ncbi:Leucine rich repeat N-terminal domain [Seminavis robusta]|uniref:Leucine rich repeat N-terminal domain n=1 Tax=Seminavis robusta TaxID=568900 RepID=A0A9N8E6A4_9STRA|nr:Leucine rich repeat N-terminal domain [Seminavis robusta]|eukprot:Sro541_g163200.1 Leucine rich repeat N-terminal domain (882) ;mRNA; f:35381-38268